MISKLNVEISSKRTGTNFPFIGFSGLALSFLPCMMQVMYSWKLLKFLNILRRSLEQVCALDSLPFLGSFCG